MSNESVTPIQILFAVSMPYPEGRSNTRRIRAIAGELVRQGHQVCVFLPFSRVPQPAVQVIEGTKVEFAAVPQTENAFLDGKGRVKLSVHFFSRCRWLMGLWRKSKRREYDWLYLYQPGIDGLLATLIARCFRRKVVSDYVDILSADGYYTFILRLVYLLQVLADWTVPALSHLVLVISSRLEGVYRGRCRHAAMIRFPIVVDTHRFRTGDRNRHRQQLNLGDRPCVVYAGSFARPQGLRVLIEAMVKVIEVKPDAVLLVAGGSLAVDADNIHLLIEQNRLDSNTWYLGLLTEKDVIDLLSAADVLVLPKLDDPVNHAGLSTKLGEYLASGNAVIASNVSDISTYLTHEYDALIVPPGDCYALAEAILRLLDDNELRQSLGANGRLVALREFDLGSNVARLVECLQRI